MSAGERYVIRPATAADVDLEARIWTESEPDEPLSADQVRRWRGLFRDPRLYLYELVVEDWELGGEGVAFGGLSHSPSSFATDQYWISVRVDAAHRGLGIGTMLYRALEEQGVQRTARVLWAAVRTDDARGVRFFERAGFEERRRLWVSRLDVAAARLPDPAAHRDEWTSAGVEFSTLREADAARPEVRELLYRLWTAASEDVPRLGEYTPVTYEQFVNVILRADQPAATSDVVFLARVADEYVGVTTLEHGSGAGTLEVGFTGTLRAHRGKGIAAELKRRAVEYAQDHGYRYLVTRNDSENRPLWAINERMGFRPIRTWVQGEKVLSTRS